MKCVTSLSSILLLFSMFSTSTAPAVPGIHDNTFRIMLLVPWSHEWSVGPYLGSAIQVGIDSIVEKDLLPGYTIDFNFEDTWCKSLRGVEMALKMWAEMTDVDFVLGDGCSTICQPSGLLSAAWNVPQISYACAAGVLSNKQLYPTFARVMSPWSMLAPLYNAIADEFNHTRVGLITEPAELMQTTAETVKIFMEARNKLVYYSVLDSSVAGTVTIQENYDALKDQMNYLSTVCRAIFIVTFGNDVRNALIAAYELGMLTGEFLFVAMDVMSTVNIPAQEGWLYPDFGPELFNGMIIGQPSEPTGPAYDQFRQDVIDAFQDSRWDDYFHLPANASITEVDTYAVKMYDAMLLWAHAVNRTLEAGDRGDDGIAVANNMFNFHFMSDVTGEVSIDSKGDLQIDYILQMPKDGEFETVAHWWAREARIEKLYKPLDPEDWDGLNWGGNSTTPPKNQPTCGWDNEFCVVEVKTFPIYAIVIIAIAVIAAIFGVLYAGYRRMKYMNDLKEATLSCVNWSDVHLDESARGALSRISMVSKQGMSKQKFIDVAKFRDAVVAVRFLGTIAIDVNNMDIRTELMMMRAIDHDNMNPFVGIVITAPFACILMSYANKGSLMDVLNDETVRLTWDFKVSLANDISRGLHFIHHSSLLHHGHLSSANCVIDNRWVCKLTDYGFPIIRAMSNRPIENNVVKEKKIWVAPEILRGQAIPSATGDIYSFGIICQEIALEGLPFCKNPDEPVTDDIIANVTKQQSPPYRPTLPTSMVNAEWRDMITRCWDESPSQRPSASEVQSMIKNINGGKPINLVDNMINMLEKHTRNLEAIVAQRSKELQDEKGKMEVLLLELLPKSVADILKVGKQAVPETFDCISLYFSDIVGFTAISAQSTPMQIVMMLNQMYTVFDEVSSKHDVYKVATIGDAYMVASGVPIRNGTRHAVEICRMALGLLAAIGDFKVSHLPGQFLRLRCGVHTGGVVAGVAGVKMPRYLLFGDTVDQASKMESSGEPMRIHVSQTTHALLDEESFVLHYRWEMDVKGFGIMKTYWLEGIK